jgi:hypothetical protein
MLKPVGSLGPALLGLPRAFLPLVIPLRLGLSWRGAVTGGGEVRAIRLVLVHDLPEPILDALGNPTGAQEKQLRLVDEVNLLLVV